MTLREPRMMESMNSSDEVVIREMASTGTRSDVSPAVSRMAIASPSKTESDSPSRMLIPRAVSISAYCVRYW